MFLAMEYVPGQTLREVIDTEGSLTPRAAIDIMVPVLDALAAAHRAGIIHRDVKPENVILREDGAVKVADFGLARAVTSQTVTSSSGLLLGTVAYLSPEQVERGIADARSDVYAAGLVLFEMLTGSKAFDGDTAINIAYQHVHTGAPRLRSRTPRLPRSSTRSWPLRRRSTPTDGRPTPQRSPPCCAPPAASSQPTSSTTARRPSTPRRRPSPARRHCRSSAHSRHRHPTGPSLRDQVRGAPPATAGVAVRTTPPRHASPRRVALDPRHRLRRDRLGHRVVLPRRPGCTDHRPGRRRQAGGRGRVLVAHPAPRPHPPGGLQRDRRQRTRHLDEPQANAEVRRGTSVTLVVSKGPERYVVPTAGGGEPGRGPTRSRAPTSSSARSPKPSVKTLTTVRSSPPTPRPARQLKRGTSVALTVSKGRQPITVEDFTGKPFAPPRKHSKAGLSSR